MSTYQKLCSKKQYLEACLQYLISQSPPDILKSPKCGWEQSDTFPEPTASPSLFLGYRSGLQTSTIPRLCEDAAIRIQWLL